MMIMLASVCIVLPLQFHWQFAVIMRILMYIVSVTMGACNDVFAPVEIEWLLRILDVIIGRTLFRTCLFR